MTFHEALQFVMDNASFQDGGPWGEGWPSAKMQEATDILNKWLLETAPASKEPP